MKRNSKPLVIAVIAMLVLCFGVVACSSGTSGSNSGSSAAKAQGILNEKNPDASSLMMVSTHPKGTFSSENEPNSTCASCHTADKLVEAGVGKLVDLDSGTMANPHANHQYLNCTDCHSVSSQSTLMCNSCHEFTLPDGWANPTVGAAQYAYEFDASGALELDYASDGRQIMEFPAEVTDGQVLLAAQAEAAGMTVEEFVAATTAQFAEAMANTAGGASAE